MAETWGSVASVNSLAKRLYPVNVVENLVNETVETYGKLTTKKGLGGASSYLPIKTIGNESGQGNITESGTLPTAGKQTTQQVVPTPKIFVHNVGFTGLSLSMLKGNAESFANTMTFHMDQGYKDAAKELNAQAFRDGTNSLGYITTLATTTIALTSGVATHFRPGMELGIGTTAGTEVTTGSVVSVTMPTTVNGTFSIVLTTGTVGGATSYVWRADEYNMGFEGLPAIASTSSTYMGLAKATNASWQGLNIDAGTVNLSDAILNRARGLMNITAGTKANCVISNDTQFRMFLADTLPQVQFEAGKRDSTPNVAYSWNGMPWVVDTDCAFDEVYLVDKKQFYLFENYGLKFDDSDGNVLKYITTTDTFSAYIKTYANYGTQNCRAFCRIHSLNVPIVG